MKDGYAICFNEWALDPDIKNELRLLLIVSSLSAERGYCFASNKRLAELFNEEEETISRKLKKLIDKNYIRIEYTRRGCEVIDRKIRLTKISIHDYQKYQSTIDENIKENNTSINNTSNNKKESIERKRFKPPTLEEVNAYIQERQLKVDGKKFYDYFDVGKWVDSKGNPVKNWKQKLITWNSYGQKKPNSNFTNRAYDNLNQLYAN